MKTDLKNKLAEAYLDYVNNFLSVDLFAGHYGLTEKQAHEVIALGREIHEAETAARPTSKDFKVVAVSTNTNAFGLKSIILVVQDGEAWQILKSPYGRDTLPKYGDVVKRVNDRFQCGTYEVPSRLADCPAKAVKEIWG